MEKNVKRTYMHVYVFYIYIYIYYYTYIYSYTSIKKEIQSMLFSPVNYLFL